MERNKQNKKQQNLTKLNSDRVQLIYFNNRVVKVPVISVALSDGGKQSANNAPQKKDPSKIELQQLGLELEVPSYTSQFQRKLGSSSENSPTELLVEEEALEKLKQHQIDHIKVVHSHSTVSSKNKATITPVSKKAATPSSTLSSNKKNAITSKSTSSNQRRSKSAPPTNVKSSKPPQKSTKTPSVDHFLNSSKGLPVPRLLVDVTSTSHQPSKKPSTVHKATLLTPSSSTAQKHRPSFQNELPTSSSRPPLFSLSSSSSDSSDYDYTIQSINNRINSQLTTSTGSYIEPSPAPTVEERGRSSTRTADRTQTKRTPSKSASSSITVNDFIRDTKKVIQKERSQRDRIKEVLTAQPAIKKQEKDSEEPVFRTPQPPTSKPDALSRMREIKHMFQSQPMITSESETDDERSQQRMQAFLQRIRKTPSMEGIPFEVNSKKKVENEEGLTDREERIKLKEKMVDEKANSLKKLKNELEFKELEIFKLQEETLSEIEKQKERLRKKEEKLRKFRDKMKLANALESDLEDGTSSASEWNTVRPFLDPHPPEEHKGSKHARNDLHKTEDNNILSEEELIKNEIDNRILELRKLLENKRQEQRKEVYP